MRPLGAGVGAKRRGGVVGDQEAVGGAADSPQGQATHNEVHDTEFAVMSGTHNGDVHVHPPREQPRRLSTGVAWGVGAVALIVAVAILAALVFVLVKDQWESRSVEAAKHERAPTSAALTSLSPAPSPTQGQPPSVATTTSRSSVAEPPPRPTSHPAFTRVEEFTPPPAADPDPCTPSQLCAYRGVVSKSPQFDLPVSDRNADVCFTVRADDPGFATLVKGSSHHIDLYPGRKCTGKPEVAPLVPHNSMAFHFFSYVVRR
jgi:hypothetical protein